MKDEQIKKEELKAFALEDEELEDVAGGVEKDTLLPLGDCGSEGDKLAPLPRIPSTIVIE